MRVPYVAHLESLPSKTEPASVRAGAGRGPDGVRKRFLDPSLLRRRVAHRGGLVGSLAGVSQESHTKRTPCTRRGGAKCVKAFHHVKKKKKDV